MCTSNSVHVLMEYRRISQITFEVLGRLLNCDELEIVGP
jgi:hypothetical protein